MIGIEVSIVSEKEWAEMKGERVGKPEDNSGAYSLSVAAIQCSLATLEENAETRGLVWTVKERKAWTKHSYL